MMNFDESNMLAIEENDENVQEEEKSDGPTKLPQSRVRRIMKTDSDVNIATLEAVFLMTKATELFVEVLVKEAHKFTLQSKKKTIQRQDVDLSVDSVDQFAFLDGMLEV